MSKEDYREKIEEHRQSIDVEKPNSRQSRSRVVKSKKPRRRDPLMTTLAVIFIFIPLVVLVYVWGFYTPTTPSQAQGKDESLEYEKNNKVENEETSIDEPNLIDDMVDENKEENDESEDDDGDSKQDEQEKEEPKTNNDTKSENDNSEQVTDEQDSQDNKQVRENEHKVSSGDTLYSIATKNNTTVDAIMEANGLKTPDIQVGQVLIIP